MAQLGELDYQRGQSKQSFSRHLARRLRIPTFALVLVITLALIPSVRRLAREYWLIGKVMLQPSGLADAELDALAQMGASARVVKRLLEAEGARGVYLIGVRGVRDEDMTLLTRVVSEGRLRGGVREAADVVYLWEGMRPETFGPFREQQRSAFEHLLRHAADRQERNYVLWRYARSQGVPEAVEVGETYLDEMSEQQLQDHLGRIRRLSR